MKKISFVSAINDFNFIVENMSDLNDLMNNKYNFEVFFVHDKYLPKELSSTRYYTFIQAPLNASYSDKLVLGFEQANGECVLIVDFKNKNWKDYVVKLLVEWENGASIVLTKNAVKKTNFWQKVKNFFEKIKNAVYNSILLILGFNKDLLCFDTFQLFSENVYTMIKNFPHKNRYLRNFDCWIDQTTTIIYTQEKINIDKELPHWSKNLTFFAVFASILAGFVVTMIFTYPFFKQQNAIFTYIVLSITILLLLLFLTSYFLVSDLIERRTGLKNK